MAIARRYEIYLPLTYNDGRPVERRKFEQTRQELLVQFEGVTRMREEASVSLAGDWLWQGRLFSDDILTYTVYTLDVNAGDAFMRPYKPRLKQRFRQGEVLIVAQIVELF
jgi:hypothetical protein